jgi:mono/diheme cytochrome c family protein
MSRFFVPTVLVATISGLALGLLGIIARSPETHANVLPEGYARTTITYVGDEYPFTGLGLATDLVVTNLEPVARGRLLFVGFGCATCHGLTGGGGVVGPDLDPDELTPSEVRRAVSSGPRGMPAFAPGTISDEDIEAIYQFLIARRGASAAAADQ